MNSEILIAANAAIKAGEAIIDIYNEGFEVEYKSDNSPLTKADKKANEIINKYLISTEIPIISEENRETEYQIRKEWTKLWIVDPLDGTKEFIKRNGEFTVNIALVEDNKPHIGVIFVPVTKTLYLGDVLQSKAIKIQLSTFDELTLNSVNNGLELNPKQEIGEIFNIVGSRSHMNEDTKKFISEKKRTGQKVRIVSRGSSLKFCMVAEGLANVYPRFAPTMEWDTAAGHAICAAVGIDVISNDTGLPMVYNKEDLLNPHFLVG